MSIDVDNEWWKTLFDDVYLVTDARSVCNEEVTAREIDVVCEILSPIKEDRILDLCGGHGRHSEELCRRGFERCTVVDYSQYLVSHGKRCADERGRKIDFVRADSRCIGFGAEVFDCAFLMGNSLGYSRDDGSDLKILCEAHRSLKRGGRLLVEVSDGASIRESFAPLSWHEIGETVVVCRRRELEGDSIQARELVICKEKGLIRDRTYSIRLYDRKILSSLMERAGFGDVEVYTGFSPQKSKGDYGFMNQRMLSTGLKR